jgi:hypothetical protein
VKEKSLTAETQRTQRKDKIILFRKAGKTGKQEKEESRFSGENEPSPGRFVSSGLFYILKIFS